MLNSTNQPKLQVRLPQTVMDRIKAEAKKKKKTASAWARDAILLKLEQAAAGEAEGLRQLKELRDEVRQLGALLRERSELLVALSAASVASTALTTYSEKDSVESAQRKVDDHIDQSLASAAAVVKMREQLLARSA